MGEYLWPKNKKNYNLTTNTHYSTVNNVDFLHWWGKNWSKNMIITHRIGVNCVQILWQWKIHFKLSLLLIFWLEVYYLKKKILWTIQEYLKVRKNRHFTNLKAILMHFFEGQLELCNQPEAFIFIRRFTHANNNIYWWEYFLWQGKEMLYQKLNLFTILFIIS